jgi:uncharacterized protein (TIGR03066 family)
MRAILSGSLTAVLVLCVGVAADDKKAEPFDAEKLLGRWEADAPLKALVGLELEFKKDGKATLWIGTEGPKKKEDGTYEVKGNKVELKFGTQKGEAKIVKLTKDTLELDDSKAGEMKFTRVKDKK